MEKRRWQGRETDRRMRLGVEGERERGDSAQAESTARVTRLSPSADHSCDHSLWRSAQCAASASRLRVGLIAFRGEEFRIEMSILGSRVASVKGLFSCTRIMYKGEKWEEGGSWESSRGSQPAKKRKQTLGWKSENGAKWYRRRECRRRNFRTFQIRCQ